MRPYVSILVALIGGALTACGSDSKSGTEAPVDADGDGFDSTEDCDDNDPDSYPGAPEPCNNIDNDCDGAEDLDDSDLDLTTVEQVWVDSDLDGYGDPLLQTAVCLGDRPSGTSENDLDCNDREAALNPAAEERCDDLDNDCDGLVDAADDSAIGVPSWAPDEDGDGFGDATLVERACERPSEDVVEDASDCNDSDPAINPSAFEECGDGVDADCDGADGPAFFEGDTQADCGRGPVEAPIVSMAAGDLNGDDQLDLLVGTAGSLVLAVDPVDGLIWPAESFSDGLGARVAVGDLNGDGVADAVLSGTGVDSTRVAWLAGPWGEMPVSGDETTILDVDVEGPVEFVIGGDFGEDGRADLVLASPNSPSLWFLPEGNSTAGAFEVSAPMLGANLASAGDVNGDGLLDLISGDPAGDGGAAILLGPIVDSDPELVLISAEIEASGLGIAVAGGKDLSGDGNADVLVGERLRGRVWVFAGLSAGDQSTADAIASMEGEEIGLGTEIEMAGDINNDGFEDVILGAPEALDGAGTGLLMIGAFTGVMPVATYAYDLVGEGADRAGEVVLGDFDANGDDVDDFAVATPGRDATWLFLGRYSW